MSSQQAIGILSTGSYVPDLAVLSSDVAVLTGVSAEWIERKTQIRSRPVAAPPPGPTGMGGGGGPGGATNAVRR